MEKTWAQIMAEYDALNQTSRSAQKLKLWGSVLSDAYLVDPVKANALWQRVVDINIAVDPAYAKYFVAQIFKRLVGILSREEAVRFLLMNENRLRLLVLYGFDGFNHKMCIHYVFEVFINHNQYQEIFNLLQLLAEKEGFSDFTEGYAELFFYSCREELVSVSNKYTPKSPYYTAAIQKILDLFDVCKKQYPKTKFADFLEIYKTLILHKPINDMNTVIRYIGLMKKYMLHEYYSFLFLERELFSTEEIISFVEDYCADEDAPHWGYYIDFIDSPHMREQEAWYENLFIKSEKIQDGALLRRRRRFGFREIILMDKLISVGDFSRWILLLTRFLCFGDEDYVYTCVEYIEKCAYNAQPPKVCNYSWGSSVVANDFAKLPNRRKRQLSKSITIILAFFDDLGKQYENTLKNLKELIIAIPSISSEFERLGFDKSFKGKKLAQSIKQCGEAFLNGNVKLKKDLDQIRKEKEIHDQKESQLSTATAIRDRATAFNRARRECQERAQDSYKRGSGVSAS